MRAVEREVEKQLATLSRNRFIKVALERNGWLIHIKDLRDAVDVANALAPEHCELMTRGARRLAKRIVTAGAIFVGPWSPTVLGDYVAGPSHTLPTGGAGRSFSGLTIDQFQRRTSIVEYSRSALAKSVGAVEKIAGMEGLDAHGRSATIRLDK